MFMGFLIIFLMNIAVMSFTTVNIQASYPCKMVVSVPVANLVDMPGFDNHARRGVSCSNNVPHLQTQLLCNEQVLALEEVIINDNRWVKVKAQEQKKISFDHEGRFVLSHYPGWMRAQDLSEIVGDNDQQQSFIVSNAYKIMCSRDEKTVLSFGTKINLKQQLAPGFYDAELLDGKKGIVLDGKVGVIERNSLAAIPNLAYLDRDFLLQMQLRHHVVEYARFFLGMPYVWGGSSIYRPDADHLTGVDCSSLIYLCYRVCGFEIPRDAHDQFLATYPVSAADMKSGDLVFFGKACEDGQKKKIRINHVLMYTDQETLIEAWGDGQVDADQCPYKDLLGVREISVSKRLGNQINQLADGDFLESENLFVYFRTVFPRVE